MKTKTGGNDLTLAGKNSFHKLLSLGSTFPLFAAGQWKKGCILQNL